MTFLFSISIFQSQRRLLRNPQNVVSLLNVHTICDQVLHIYKGLFTPQINIAYIDNISVAYTHDDCASEPGVKFVVLMIQSFINNNVPQQLHIPCARGASGTPPLSGGGMKSMMRLNVK